VVKTILIVILIFCFSSNVIAGYSFITEAEGYACISVDKSRLEAEIEARNDAKRSAADNAYNFINPQHGIVSDTPFVVSAAASIQVLNKEWHKDEKGTDCVKVKIRAEVAELTEKNPWTDHHKKITLDDVMTENSGARLNIKVWSDKKEYRQSEQIRVRMKGNQPFYAKILLKDGTGRLFQILPSPCHANNYFQGGIVHEIPSHGDCYEIKADSFSTEDVVIFYASSSPLGELEIEREGNIYVVRTSAKDLSKKVREVKFDTKPEQKRNPIAEFIEKTLKLNIIQ
jgi:hypothetical protein